MRQRHQKRWPWKYAGGGLLVLITAVAAYVYTRPGLTYARDVAPIVSARCATCHRPGEAAPFSLLTYDDVHKRSRQIVEVTQKRQMPPWMPTAGHGDFADARRLSDDELRILKRWVESGAPPGDLTHALTPSKVEDRWQSDPPDLVLESPDFRLEAGGGDVFRNFVIRPGITQPRWVRSVEVRPTNPRVTHHARLGVDSTTESMRRDAEDEKPGYDGMAWGQDPDGQLVIWAPGMTSATETPRSAWRLFPQSVLVLHAHLQPSGKSESVKFRVGIRFAKDAPEQYPAVLRIGSCDIDLPAGARRHVVADSYQLPIDVDLHTVFPHAHSLCRSMSLVAERPDGRRDPLITIEQFDENWHEAYRYRVPVWLPRGTRLVSTFTYDNSDDNPRNRHRPARRVVYGSRADDEMADVYLQVTPTHEDQRAVLMEDYRGYDVRAQLAGLRRTLEHYPDDPWSQEALAACNVGIGEFATAVALLNKRLSKGRKEVFPITSLGMALLLTGDAEQAEAKLREAVALDGEYPLAWLGLGKVLAARQQWAESEAAVTKACTLAPGNVEARLMLVVLLIHRGAYDQARVASRAALNDAPDASAVHLKLAEIEAREKRYVEALGHCSAAHRLAPYTHPPRVLLGMLCIANGDGDTGVRLLREAREEFPRHPMPALVLGQLALRFKQWPQAAELLIAAGQLPPPDNWPASHRRRFLLSLYREQLVLAQQTKNSDLQRDALTKLIELEPGNVQLKKALEEMKTAGP